MTGAPRPEDANLVGVKPFRSGSAAHGDFSYAALAPVEPGVGAIALYFIEGKLGLVYAPLVHDNARRYSGVSLSEFEETILVDYGFRLLGLGVGASDATPS